MGCGKPGVRPLLEWLYGAERLNSEHFETWLAAARAGMEIEARAITAASERLDGAFCQAVQIILRHPGKLVVTGVGKSGHIGRKLVATFCSVGVPAVFLHAGEAGHGDLGVYAPGDPTLLISKSGATPELLALTPMLREFGSPRIGMLGAPNSELARRMDAVLDASVEREADPANVTPTASAAVALALGHALAIALMTARNFSPDEFGRLHPSGALGRGLNWRVCDAMTPVADVARVTAGDSLKQVVIAMTNRPLGAACVMDAAGSLLGLVTDGDVRRALQAHDDIRPLRAADVMTPAPVTIAPDARLFDALRLMEDRPSQISLLPVVDGDAKLLGLIRLHDVYRGNA